MESEGHSSGELPAIISLFQSISSLSLELLTLSSLQHATIATARAEKEFGFEAKISFEDGLKETIDWSRTFRISKGELEKN